MANGKVLEALVSIAGQVDPSLQKSLKQAKGHFSGVQKAAKVTGAVAAAGLATATTAAVAATKALYDLGTEFQEAKNTIRVGTGATGEALDALYTDMQEVYKDIPTTMEDASSAIADYNTRLGLTGEPLQEISKQAIEVADMLGEDLTGVIEESSQAFKQWNVDSVEMSKEMDYIFKVCQSTGMGFNDLMSHVQSSGAVLQDLGYNFDEAAAMIANLDKAGINTEQVLKGMKKGLGNIAKDGGDAVAAMNQYCEQIQKAGSETEAITIATEIFGSATAVTMAQAIRSGAMSVDELTASLNSSDESIMGAAKDTYTLTDKFDMMKQKAQVALEPIASSLIDMVNEAFPYIEQAMDEIFPIFQGFATELLPVLQDVGGTLLPVISTALQSVGGVIQELLPYAATAIKTVIGFVTQLLPLLMNFASGILPLIESVLQTVFDVLEQLMPIFMEIISAVLPVIQQLIVALMPVITTLFQALSPIISLVGNLVSALLPPLVSIINSLMPIITLVADIISTVLMVAIQALSPVIEGIITLVGSIADIFSTVFEGIVGIVSKPINAIIGIVNSAIDAINEISVEVPDWVPIIGGTTFGFDIPNVPTFASGGFTDGVSIAGEAGTEAIISFDPAYRSENLSYWAKAGQILGATDSDLLSLIEDAGGYNGGSTQEVNLGGVTFAPNITIQGSATKEDVIAAIRAEEPEFFDLLEEFIAHRGDDSYEPAY